MPLVKTIAASFLWLFLWGGLIAIPVSKFLANPNPWGGVADAQYLPSCLTPNIIRSSLYAVLFLGCMLICRRFFLNKTALNEKFFAKLNLKQLFLTAKTRITTCKTKIGVLRLLGANCTWLLCWYMVSASLYFFTSSHFMNDCDNGDLECHCYNLPYLAPVFTITSILGCFYITGLTIVGMLDSTDSLTSNS